MVTSTCHCGALIGGTSHISVMGNIDVVRLENVFSLRGYSYSSPNLRLPSEIEAFLRLIVHMCLLLHLQLGMTKSISLFLFEKNKSLDDCHQCKLIWYCNE
jgi:hypothetical protein